jgi:putative endonuclease
MKNHNYYVYITTNISRSVVYIGVTNNLSRRMAEHFEAHGNPKTFTGRYNCHILVYWERFQYINHAIAREKEIKKWRRAKKDVLIASMNPTWEALDPN